MDVLIEELFLICVWTSLLFLLWEEGVYAQLIDQQIRAAA